MFYTFDEINKDTDLRNKVGRKSESLIDMMAWGLPVPSGGCITTTAFKEFISHNKFGFVTEIIHKHMQDDNQKLMDEAKRIGEVIINGEFPSILKERIEGFIATNKNACFAVRSSGTKEDMGEKSFAGQYCSFLNVRTGNELYDAIKKCWASLFNKRVISYCKNNGIAFNDMSIAVILQEMIPAEKSGVIFTVNSLKGYDKEMILEACFGVGEALVSGEITPDHYCYDWYNKVETKRKLGDKKISIIPVNEPPFTKSISNSPEKQKEFVLSQDEVKELAEIAVKIQAAYGFPVDIEWAKFDGKFYVVQSRPITKISYSGIPGEWTTADFKDGGVSSTVCSQFMWSLYEMVWEITMPSYLKKVNLIDKSNGIKWGDMFFGRPYWNVHEIKGGLKRLPGYNERIFDEELGIKVCYKGNGYVTKTTPKSIWAGLKVLTALNKSIKDQNKVCIPFREQQKKKLNELDKFDPVAMKRKEFFKFYEKFIKEEYFLSESTYFYLIFNNSNFSSLFMQKFKKINADLNYLNLISGLQNLSHLLPNYRLWKIRNKIMHNNDLYKFWKEKSIEELVEIWRRGSCRAYMDDVRNYINDFKYHSSRELDITVPRYGEDPSSIMKMVKTHLDIDDSHDPIASNKKQYEAYEEERAKFLKAVPFYKRKNMAKMLDQLREFLWWREELRDLSTQYYYHVRRFTLILAEHFKEMGIADHVNDIFYLPVNDIFKVMNNEILKDQAKVIIMRNKLYYNSFKNFTNPNEIGSRFVEIESTKKTGNKILKGIPCSTGLVTGKIKVIKDIFDADRLEQGDILITKFTDPGWTSHFSLLAGVATETGGVLSHAAVISREYGIPAVLAVENITQLLKDGQTITIDGYKGEIIIC
ncbi:MAG: hypothetical protein A2176_07280 [Spirochaetes bacterium RBG_13_51_14]|nr:MAG: hypothetical protein A2176_07280 [Spirochaetes bacterium RBG_13_51_14]